MTEQAQENGRETLERTLRDVARGGKSETGRERMVAALALCMLLQENVTTPLANVIVQGTKS